MMRFRHWLASLSSRERTITANRQLGVMLAFIAGAVNAGGFMVIDRYTSHMTGIVSSIATSLALDAHPMVLAAVFFVLSFIAGAMAASVFINVARVRYIESEYALALMVEAALLIVFSLCATHVLPLEGSFVVFTVALLCFIMGLQNAISSKMSRGEVRTTHMTGICTDIGIELGRYLFKSGSGLAIPFDRDKLQFHTRMLLAFLTGGVLGAEAFAHVGFVSIIPLALLLIAIAIAPLWDASRPAAP